MPIIIKSPVFRASFCSLFEKDSKGKFSVAMLFSKDTMALTERYFGKEAATLKHIKAAAMEAAKEKWGDKIPPKVLTALKHGMPLRCGSEKEHLDGYSQGMKFAPARSQQKPGVVDANCDLITDSSEVYSGMYCIAELAIYAYDNEGQGVTCGLNHVQKIKDGEQFSSATSVEDAGFVKVQIEEEPGEDGDDGLDGL
jgi:hypothetical protein